MCAHDFNLDASNVQVIRTEDTEEMGEGSQRGRNRGNGDQWESSG